MSAIDDATQAILEGKLVVIPTDTVYGLATRADSPSATARIFEAKGRLREADLPVFIDTYDQARGLADWDFRRGEIIAQRFWPGPLTLVLRRSDASRSCDLGGDGSTIGLRMPGHPLARAILRNAGIPLAVTSANVSGQPTPSSGDEVSAIFGDSVSIYLLEEKPLTRRPSTVVDLSRGDLRVLRAGAISEEDIRNCLPPDERSL